LETFIADLRVHWKDRPFAWNESMPFLWGNLRLPASGKVLVLGPHPDDPETVAITCRLLKESGCDIWWAIVSLSPSGVEDEYARRSQNSGFLSLSEMKAEIRRREQVRSAEMFGLGPGRLTFLGLEEGRELDSWPNRAKIRTHLEFVAPDIIIMPVGKDANPTHAWVSQVFRDCAKGLALMTRKPLAALYNEDPKTLEIRRDLSVFFGEGGAEWKRALLRAHDSQQQRNIQNRHMGFDERILRMNQLSGRRFCEISHPVASSCPYAEVFEIELIDFPPPGC
jgi:LmbE family N-acetylglucosaminyl deacetylase